MKKIVFDLGGVLLTWQPRALLRRVLPHIATDERSAAHWEQQIFQGYGGDWSDFDRGTVGVDDLVQRISRRTGLAAAEVRTVVDAVPHELQPVPETVALLNALADAGQELFYLSNMPAPYAERLLAANSFFARFRDGVFSARVHQVKPEPAIFELAAASFGSGPDDLVLIDDHAPNVAAARAQGWHAIRFSSAAQAADELCEFGWARPW